MACILLRVALVSVAVVAAAPAQADIFRCIGANGKTLYSDAPCPEEAVHRLNITSSVGGCATAECAARRAQDSADARQRLQADKAEVQAWLQLRAQEDAARAQTQLWQQTMEAKLASMDYPVEGPSYVMYPTYPFVGSGGACGWRCMRSRNGDRHHQFGHHHNHAQTRGTAGVALRTR